jgi:3-oxoacyl-[acyl-carrier protein] reductase
VRTALVTGAGRPGSLGAALCERLADAGCAVAVHYHQSREGAERLASRLPHARAFGGDLSTEAGAAAVVAEVVKEMGGLDVLLNNAGVYHRTPLLALSEAQWREGLDSTAGAVFFTTRAALPHLAAGGSGRVVNLGDAGADKSGPRDLAVSYHIGKAGVWLLTKSFAQLAAPTGVTVNQVSPGYLGNSVDIDAAPEIPAGRVGTFDDIWNAVEFLLKPESGYLTGSNLKVSGGWSL